MVKRRVLPGEVEAALRRYDVFVQQSLLARLEQREGAPGELIVVPHHGRAAFVLIRDLRVDAGHVLYRLRQSLRGWQLAPALGVLRPGVRGQKDAATCLAPVFRVVDVAHG